MAAQVLSFFQRSPRYTPAPADWSQQELAEFYRVESALIRAGVRVGTDRGLSDEKEPWFVFYRADDGEVVIHFARIDGEYVIAGPAYEEIARGFDFSALVRNMVARHPLIRRSDNGGNISVHPAALLVAVVGTAFFKTGEARAAETGATNAHSGHSRPALLSSSSNAGVTYGVASMAVAQPPFDTAQLPANQAVVILAAALLASDYGVNTASIDPAARAAISAAAAALDFSAPPTSPHVSEAGFTLGAAGHVTTVDNSPAQTVSSVLSLVALLSTLPSATEAPASGEALAAPGIDPIHHETFAASLPSNDPGAWSIDVRLGLTSGGLPAVEAVQLVRDLAGEAGAQKITIIEVAKLPDILADLISKGEHQAVTQPSVTPPADPTGTTPPPSIDNPPPAAQDPTPPANSNPTPAEPQQPSHPTYSSPEFVKQFIDYFIAHTTSVEVMAKGSQIVIFDARVMHDVGLIVHLDSMTFDFADGSSISLVGDHSSFLHDGNLI